MWMGYNVEILLIHLVRLGWGSFLLAHMYHEMHQIAYQEGKSMATGVLVLQIWAWEHILICKPIVDDSWEAHQLIVCWYSGYVTQPYLGKTKFWRRQLDDLITVVWIPYRGLEPWDDWRAQRRDIFMTRPLIS